MADAVAVSVAKAVTAQLAAAELSQAFVPERSYADWDLKLADADCLHVDVVLVTTAQETELSTRTRSRFTVPIDIAVRKRFGRADQDDDTGRIDLAAVDELMLLVEEIHELFTPRRPEVFNYAAWQETKILVAPERKLLREHRQFVGIVRVTFRAEKAA